MRLLVDRDPRQRDAFRSGRDHDRAGLDFLAPRRTGVDRDPAGRRDARLALEPIDLVLAEQELDAARQGTDDLVLARHHRAQVEPDLADPDPVLGQRVPASTNFSDDCSSAFDGMQPILRQVPPSVARDVDAGRPHAELGRPDRRDIAARPRPDHDDVVTLGHCRHQIRSPGECRDPLVQRRSS